MRLAIALATAGLLLAGSPPPVEAEDELPRKTTVRPWTPRKRGERPVLERLYLLPEGRTPAEAPALLRTKIDRVSLLLADVDGDGRYDEPGVDGWCVLGDTHLLPIKDPFVLGHKRLRIRVGPERKQLRYALEPIDAPPRLLACLSELNALRRRNGLPTADIDAELSEGCLLHARYCDRWGQQHAEDPTKDGYTEAGAAAGLAASIGKQIEWMPVIYQQFFHRFSLTEPDTVAFGLAQSAEHALVDGMRGKGEVPFVWPVAIPAHGSVEQPKTFDRTERPPAYPDGAAPGLPITLQFQDFRTFEDVEAQLTDLRQPGAPVDIWVSWPGKPAHPTFPRNYRAILVVPQEPLRRGAEYEVVVSYPSAEEGERTEHRWRFRTARTR